MATVTRTAIKQKHADTGIYHALNTIISKDPLEPDSKVFKILPCSRTSFVNKSAQGSCAASGRCILAGQRKGLLSSPFLRKRNCTGMRVHVHLSCKSSQAHPVPINLLQGQAHKLSPVIACTSIRRFLQGPVHIPASLVSPPSCLQCTHRSMHCTHGSMHCTHGSMHCTPGPMHCTHGSIHCTHGPMHYTHGSMYRTHESMPCTYGSMHCARGPMHCTHGSMYP